MRLSISSTTMGRSIFRSFTQVAPTSARSSKLRGVAKRTLSFTLLPVCHASVAWASSMYTK